MYAQTLNTPLLRLTEKSNLLFAEGREKGHLQENYFGDTVLCVLGEVTIIRSYELTCDETKTDRKAFLLTNFSLLNVALTIKRQTLG